MAGLGNIVTTKLITKGLSCGHRADTGIITSFFGLVYVRVNPPGYHDFGGGSIPLGPGEIANLFKPVQDIPASIYIPRDQEHRVLRPKFTVNITVNGHETTYLVSERTGNTIAKVMNMINISKNKIEIAINNLMTRRGLAKVSKLRKKIFDNEEDDG